MAKLCFVANTGQNSSYIQVHLQWPQEGVLSTSESLSENRWEKKPNKGPPENLSLHLFVSLVIAVCKTCLKHSRDHSLDCVLRFEALSSKCV